MSEQSEREWKSYLLSKGVFGNALRFAHLEKPEEVDRTSMGAAGLDPSDQVVRNRIRFVRREPEHRYNGHSVLREERL